MRKTCFSEKKINLILLGVLFFVITVTGCSSNPAVLSSAKKDKKQAKVESEKESKTLKKVFFKISSSVIPQGRLMPRKYTCQGMDVSPQLAWSNPPKGTKSFVLIIDDSDVPEETWVHWILYNIPAETRFLHEDISFKNLPSGCIEGKNSWKKLGYLGPCPPDGTHRYFFKLYAVDKTLDLKAGATKDEVLKEMENHILAGANFMSLYNKD